MLVLAAGSMFTVVFFQRLLSAELMLLASVVKCRSLVEQWGGAVWNNCKAL